MLLYDNITHQVTLCGRRKCCPKAELIGEDKVKIIDDDGREVIMTVEQAKLIPGGIQLLKEKKKQLLHD